MATMTFRLSPAFIPSVPPRHSRGAALPATTATTFTTPLRPPLQTPIPRGRIVHRSHCVPTANFTQDFFTGPSSPPRPRPLYQVVLFSVTTNLLWYGFYKYCIEEELRAETGHGLGGFLALTPFVVGVTAPFYAPTQTLGQIGIAAGFAWIAAVQFWLYRRINDVVLRTKGFEPLTPWWLLVPGFNLVVGFRSMHFLAVAWGFQPEDDPVVQWFPFLGTESLGIVQMLTTPSLWLRIPSSSSSDS